MKALCRSLYLEQDRFVAYSLVRSEAIVNKMEIEKVSLFMVHTEWQKNAWRGPISPDWLSQSDCAALLILAPSLDLGAQNVCAIAPLLYVAPC